MYRIATDAEVTAAFRGGESHGLQGYFDASCKVLTKKFGPPTDGDGYKVSTEWKFLDDAGHLYSLYDYKDTDLYDPDNPSVETFRKRSSFQWHVGAADKRLADAFIRWLIAELG